MICKKKTKSSPAYEIIWSRRNLENSYTDSLSPEIKFPYNNLENITSVICLLHVFPLIRLHELTQITDAYQWNAHDHLE